MLGQNESQVNKEYFRKICERCGATAEGDEYKACCPAHHDKNPSLSLKLFDSGVICVHCWAGCEAGDLAKSLGVQTWKKGDDGRLIIPPSGHRSCEEPKSPGITLDSLGEYTGIDPLVLRNYGLREWKGMIVVPYKNWDGTKGRSRLRTSLTGKNKYKYGKKGPPIIPYQLSRLRSYKDHQARHKLALKSLWIVEGESDCWALWHHGYPAVGIPGAGMTKTIQQIQAKWVEDFSAVVVWQEPDAAGGKFVLRVLDHLESLKIDKRKIKVVAGSKYKDPCEIFKKPWTLATVNELLENAITVEEFRAVPDHYTQLDVSRAFAKHFSRGRFLHNGDLGGWLAWNGACYAPKSDHAVYLRMVDYIEHLRQQGGQLKNEEIKKAYDKLVKSLSHTDGINGSVRGVEAFLHVDADEFDADPLAINLRNGWYDLNAHQFRPHGKPARFTRAAGTHYDDGADCPLWRKCVDDYWEDPEIRRYFRRQCGLLLAGETYKHMVYFYGVGDNGKSMVVELLRAVLGDYAAVLDVEDLLLKGQQGVPYSLADLRGVRLVTTSELPDGARLNEGLIKKITGGTAILARQIYGKPFAFVPQFKLWFDGNFKPNLSTDEATWGRFHLLPFARQFQRDNSLLGRLKKESAGIFNWMLEGWKDYQENDEFYPAAMEAQKEEFKQECDDYGTFLATFFDRQPEAKVAKDDAYRMFKSWWRESRPSAHVPDARRFTREWKRLGLEEQASHSKRWWLGVIPSEFYHEWREKHNLME